MLYVAKRALTLIFSYGLHVMNLILKTIHASLVCSVLQLAAPARSQITPDTTLGNEASYLTPNQIINGVSADRIDGGAIRGSNLFHSFSKFNVAILQ